MLSHLTPDLPTKIIPTEIRWLKLSGRYPVEMRMPTLKIEIMFESNPRTTRILVRMLAVFVLVLQADKDKDHL